MTVRGFFRAVKVESAKPPYDTIHLKVLYPAQISGSQQQLAQGILPADSDLAPFPIVIFFGGINCEPSMYHWLAVQLAQRGMVVVTYAWIGENLPGMVSLSPGVDIAMAKPATYGTGSTALALPALLAELESLQANGILAGMLNLEQIILGGHSAGGRMALENANPRFYPQVAAAFAYGAHSAAATMLGFPPNTILPLPSDVPMLLMGGTRDGVIAANRWIYGMSGADPTESIRRTFEEAIAGGRDDKYLLLLEGANHFSIAYPSDSTVGSSLQDLPATQPEDAIRSLLGDAVGLFIDAHVRHKMGASQALDELLSSHNPLVAFYVERK